MTIIAEWLIHVWSEALERPGTGFMFPLVFDRRLRNSGCILFLHHAFLRRLVVRPGREQGVEVERLHQVMIEAGIA